MTPYEAYKFCPRCSGELTHKHGNMMLCGKCGNPYFVNAAPAVGIIIENDEEKVMLVRRAIEPYKGTWDIPGGFMEPGETVEQNAIREAEEELGVKINPGLLLKTYPVTYPFKGIDLPVLVISVCAKIIEGTLTPKDDVSEIRYFSESELDSIQVMTREIKQSFLDYFNLRKAVSLNTLLLTK